MTLRAPSIAVMVTGALWLAPRLAVAAPALKLELGDPAGSSPPTAAFHMIAVLTLLSLAPALLLATTSFVRFSIVFSFLKTALGLQAAPPQQVLTGLALFLTIAVMSPVGLALYDEGLGPWLDGKLEAAVAYERGARPLRQFMLKQTRESDLALMYEVTRRPRPQAVTDVGLPLLVPAFMLSELRTGFEMGFTIMVPFLLVDLVVAAVLMALGMVMLPPAMVSLPVKVLLFVLADGWNLLVGSLLRSVA